MKKVLIVDNSSYMRTFIRKIIEKGGYNHTLEASSKDECMEIFNAEKPEIVILDLNMSEATMDGIEILKEIMEVNPNTDVIIISAVRLEEIKGECMQLGAIAYIIKPIDTEQLLNTLDGLK